MLKCPCGLQSTHAHAHVIVVYIYYDQLCAQHTASAPGTSELLNGDAPDILLGIADGRSSTSVSARACSVFHLETMRSRQRSRLRNDVKKYFVPSFCKHWAKVR
jgi:hypothetical protein